MNDTELSAIFKTLKDCKIDSKTIIESATISEDFEFYGSHALSDFPEDVESQEFIDKFKRFGGIINGKNYILPAGLDVEVSLNKNSHVRMKRNGATLDLNWRMGDVCYYTLNLTKLGDMAFKVLKYKGYSGLCIPAVLKEMNFYADLFGVEL